MCAAARGVHHRLRLFPRKLTEQLARGNGSQLHLGVSTVLLRTRLGTPSYGSRQMRAKLTSKSDKADPTQRRASLAGQCFLVPLNVKQSDYHCC